MNKRTADLLRKELTGLLTLVKPDELDFFKRIFGVYERKEIKDIVNAVPIQKLESAIGICDRTIAKHSNTIKESFTPLRP
jgi:hypothetical protein